MQGIAPVSNNKTTQIPIQTIKISKDVGNNHIVDVEDLTKQYSQNEVVDILKKVGTYSDATVYPNRYTVKYYDKAETLVINNESHTNDTTEIYKDGKVINRGSWHYNEVAPKGAYPEIVEDAKKRMEKSETK
jgi:hypothetical protein